MVGGDGGSGGGGIPVSRSIKAKRSSTTVKVFLCGDSVDGFGCGFGDHVGGGVGRGCLSGF